MSEVLEKTFTEPPEFTMPDAEAALVRSAFQDAKVIWEYGTGGSTVMASELPGKSILSVDTDQAWAKAMQDWFARHPGKSQVDIIWANVGKTRTWGRPANDKAWRDYARYPLEIWDLLDVSHPDVVLVDGRFRAGCVLACAFRCTRPVRVLVDDYAPRKPYHAVEEFVGTPKLTGRMAEFHITPTPVPAARLFDIISLLQEPY